MVPLRILFNKATYVPEGVWHDASVYCSRLQRAAPIGRSPFAALPLDPFPPSAVVPIGLSPPCVLPSSSLAQSYLRGGGGGLRGIFE